MARRTRIFRSGNVRPTIGILVFATSLTAALATVILLRTHAQPGVLASSTGIPVRFTDIASKAGLKFKQDSTTSDQKYYLGTMGTGVGWLDYERDGLMDLFFVQSAAKNGELWTGSLKTPRDIAFVTFDELTTDDFFHLRHHMCAATHANHIVRGPHQPLASLGVCNQCALGHGVVRLHRARGKQVQIAHALLVERLHFGAPPQPSWRASL